MKVRELADKMNDHGTRPRITVVHERAGRPIYDGSPFAVPEEVRTRKVVTFTATGTGALKIYVD